MIIMIYFTSQVKYIGLFFFKAKYAKLFYFILLSILFKQPGS
jgi:hypothetical protein